MKTACVYHAIDLDGWMSVAIVKYWFITNAMSNLLDVNLDNPNTIEFIGHNYDQPIPDLSEYDKVILVDISFPKEEMLALNRRLGEKLIWIDHHQRTVNEVNAYLIEKGIPMEGMVTEDGELKAACELAWEYFFPKETMPEIVRLLGRYDCFGHMGTDEERTVIEFQYGARECITNYEEAYEKLIQCTRVKESEYWRLQAQVVVGQIKEKGESIYGYLCTEAQQVYQNGFKIILPNNPIIGIVNENRCPYCGSKEVSFYNPRTKYACGTTSYDDRPGTFQRTNDCIKGSLKFICINKERFNAINFGIDYHAQGYDGQACFFRTKEGKWSFSFYSQTVDCSAIAKQFGGGGHKGAAGCVVDDETMLKIINS